ncbi:uracil-DNA glycosylase [Sphingomonas hengshuiensis]|uniref:Type-5 uracil-DNA glycosylase n=1 Tax=Sphingomonas hengshuiensis TaxID=1609977 RepID=A0A7U5BG93_9SPHN|nr:uracil-DNA glycosylase [Sphingomonas hengshuiensis]AJP74721.1 uracil-DNA glycosylase [Sphingomonas hengshuiensis]
MRVPTPTSQTEPTRDCPRCPRLVALRETLRVEQPEWWNAPVPALGERDAWLAIVGLAPGLRGANRTGRAFTGDASGDLLFATLEKFGLAEGGAPRGVIILNAVKCVPPGNKPVPAETHSCRDFLRAEAAVLPARIYVALGQIAHQSTVKALGGRLPRTPFAHLAEHRMPDGRVVIDSYHCSRYNQNTNRLTAEMFEAVFARALELRGAR